MNVMEAIRGRRSVRSYLGDPVGESVIRELIAAATYAPSGSNLQPWAFAVVENREFLKNWSDLAKQYHMEQAGNNKTAERYRAVLENPKFNIFYNAPALVAVYGNPESDYYIQDCSMATLNLMLAAYERGLGSCWIGFATDAGNLPQIREALGMPPHYKAVAPVVFGYPKGTCSAPNRRDRIITSWIKE